MPACSRSRIPAIVLPVTWMMIALSLIWPLHGGAATYHVDVNRGNDTSQGTEEEPFRTIRQASRVLRPGDTALIHEGVYHEQIMEGRSGEPGAPITYMGVDRDKVRLQGCVLVRDWRKVGNTWVKRGPEPITHVNAFVMVDEKKMLKKVEAPTNLAEGTFHLSRRGTYTIRMWNDADPNRDHRVEVYDLDFAFNSGNRWGGTAKRWIVLSTMTIEKYGTYAISTDDEAPADNANWELDRLTVRYNHAEGVMSCLDDWYVHDCTFTRNGVHGCQIDGARVRFMNNVCSENEWFGPSVDGGCGILIGADASAHSCMVKNNRFANNGHPDGYGCGIYLEGRSHDNLIEDNEIIGGTHCGVGFFGSSRNRVLNNRLVDIAPQAVWDQTAAFVVNRSYLGEPTQSVGNLVSGNQVRGCRAPLFVRKPARPVDPMEANRFEGNLFAHCRAPSNIQSPSVVVTSGNTYDSCPGNRDSMSSDR